MMTDESMDESHHGFLPWQSTNTVITVDNFNLIKFVGISMEEASPFGFLGLKERLVNPLTLFHSSSISKV
jgi:hypothetical protein